MNQKPYNFEDACKLVGIKVVETPGKLIVRTTFNPFNKFGIGSLIFLIIGFAIGTCALLLSKALFGMIAGGILGFGVGTIALLSILSDSTSYFKIIDNNVEIRNRLKLKREQLTKKHQIEMKSRMEYIKSKSGSGSYFRVIELYVTHGKNEKLLIDFQTDEKYTAIARQLGSQIAAKVRDEVRHG